MIDGPNPPISDLDAQSLAEVDSADQLARFLRQLRRRDARERGGREWTYRELAAKTAWSHATIGEYLTGKTVPPTDRFDTLIQLLGATSAEQGLLATARDRVEELRFAAPCSVASSVGIGIRPVLPRQLPAPVRHFAGRERELETLTRLIDQGERPERTVVICAVSGAAGVGKTTLAVSWAHRVAGEFPDGQLYVNLRGFDQYSAPMDPAEAIRGFLDALGVPRHQIPTGLDAQAGLYRSLLSDRRMLVLLDNARDGEQLGPLLPGASRCLVIVTSRDKLVSLVATADAQPLHLDLLTATEARELLACRLGPARTDAEPQAVDEIIEHCSRLPLALAVTAARAATRPGFPLIELVAQLRQARGGLDAFTGMGNADVRSVFSWSYRRLGPAAASLFRLLGLLPSPDVAIPAVASVAGRPTVEVRHLLTELALASLVTEHSPSRYTFHDLLRAYAAELAHTHDSDSYRRAATRRLLDHYLHTAHAASRLVYPRRQDRTAPPPRDPRAVLIDLTDHEQAMAWFTVEYPALVAAIQTAVASQLDTHAYQLAWALSVFLMLQGRWPEMIATQHTALDAARRMAEGSAQAYAHRSIGMAAVELDDHAEADAHLRRALDMLGDLGDSTGAAQTHLGFSRALERQGRHREALGHSIAAHDLYQTAGAPSGQANALNSIGWCHSLLGEYHEARAACESALSVAQEIAEHWIEAAAWDSLGYVHHHLGDHTRAAACYQRSLNLCRLLGDRPHEAETLIHLGETRHAAGDFDAARSAWRQALTIRTELNHPDTAQISAKLRHLDDGLSPA